MALIDPILFQSVITDSALQIDPVCSIVQQGIEVERIHMQYLQAAHLDIEESYSKIMEGERFLNLLFVARLC